MGKHSKTEEKEFGGGRHSSKHGHKRRKDKEEREQRKSTAKELEVHSANAWEDVQFESEEKKEKFLRLMGAQKERKHAGTIRIGEKPVKHTPAGVGVEELGKNLEKQFSEGLEHKVSWNRHAGLGCATEGSSSLHEDHSEDEEDENKSSLSKGKYMNFVKSSDK
ncbi:unnamed protein product [Hymenolepis diminuta]|uniref:Small acidic protein n=1 Tax=Hymenolepis diminuta TaxID=6216 RepID=A0A0R3SQE4_HYMDI|nr:unnamed protein product [Hymenolepis diminuta]VUZ47236.1 unnamed protein product [Hymenolepis diminuta]